MTIQKCGVLGKPKGEPVEAVARNLPKPETRRVFDMVHAAIELKAGEAP